MHQPNHNIDEILKILDAQRPIAPSDATRVEPGQVEERYPGYPHSMWSAEDRSEDPRWLGKALSESKYLPVPAHGDEARYRENVKGLTDILVPQTYGDIALEAAGGKLVSGGMLVAAVLGKYGKRAAQIASGKVKKLYNDKIGLKRKDPGVSSNDLFTELPSDNRTMAEMIADMDATQIQDASDDILQRMDISPEEAKRIVRGDPENRFIPIDEETYMRQSQMQADQWAASPEGQEAFADVVEQWSAAPSEVYNPSMSDIPRSATKGSYRTNVHTLELESPTGTHKISRKSAPNRKDHGEILVEHDAPEQWNQYEWGESIIDEASVPSTRKGYRKHTFTVRHKAAVDAMDETHDVYGKPIKKSQQAPILARMSFETKVMPNGEVHIGGLTFYKHGPSGGQGTSWARPDMQQLPPELQKRYGWDPNRPERGGMPTQGDWNYREGIYDIETKKEAYLYVDELGRSTDYAEIGGGRNAAQIMRMTFSRMPENWVLSTADNSFTMDSWTNLVKSVMREAAELHIHDDFMLVSPSSNSRFSKLFDKLKRENLGDERVAIETVVKEMAVEWEKMVGRTTRKGMKVSGSEMKFLPKPGEPTATGGKTISKAKASHFTFKGMKAAMAALFGIKISQLDEFLGQFEEVDERNHLVR